VNPLFSTASLRILESLSFTDTLYAFDFDGTLAPIVEDPSAARMTQATEKLFDRLARHVPTAVISGRSLADLRGRVPASTRYLIGNHGLEGLPGASAVQDLRGHCRAWKLALERVIAEQIQDPGVLLEDKEYSLAVHYRKSRKKKDARARILKAIQALSGELRVIPGKLVLNLVPLGGPHKGIALSRVMKHAGVNFGFFIGDDYTDEDVFGMQDHRLLTVRVGNGSASQAQYFVQRQSDINQLLRYLLKFHGISATS